MLLQLSLEMQSVTTLFHGFFPMPKLMIALILQSLIAHFPRTMLATLWALTLIYTLVVPQSSFDLEYVLKNFIWIWDAANSASPKQSFLAPHWVWFIFCTPQCDLWHHLISEVIHVMMISEIRPSASLWPPICPTPGPVLFHCPHCLLSSQITDAILNTDQGPRKSKVWEPTKRELPSSRSRLGENFFQRSRGLSSVKSPKWPAEKSCWMVSPWVHVLEKPTLLRDSSSIKQISYTTVNTKWIPPASGLTYAYLTSDNLDGGSWYHCIDSRGRQNFHKGTFLVRLNLLHRCLRTVANQPLLQMTEKKVKLTSQNGVYQLFIDI